MTDSQREERDEREKSSPPSWRNDVGLKETRRTVVTEMKMFQTELDRVEAGENVGLLLRGIRAAEVSRGQVVAQPGSITPHKRFESNVYLLSRDEGGRHTPVHSGFRPQFHIRTAYVTGIITLPVGMEEALPGESVSLQVELEAPVALEKGSRFAIRASGLTVGVGVIAKILA